MMMPPDWNFKSIWVYTSASSRSNCPIADDVLLDDIDVSLNISLES